MAEAKPALSDALATRWRIRSFHLIADTRSSYVYRVQCDDRTNAIVKQLKPSGLHELPGFDFLDWRGGNGTVRLLDRTETAALLEDAGMVMLRDYRLTHGEDASNGVVVDVLNRLHAISSAPHPAELMPLKRHFQSLYVRAADANDPLADVFAYCTAMADDLIATQENIRPLHGDLHHENIIADACGVWRAIDPQGLIGDPAYDVANIFGNPNGAFADIVDPARIITLVRLFAITIGCSEEKILRYAIAHAGLSICWSFEGGDRISAGGNASERLAFFKVARRLLETGAVSA
ncbi:streptomycin 6-kinase [Neorhizobium huautlense]|uniref:Streptomycin 6-kinase n=1 Tax=Neorhizobium huautlense TaxID=67774 RepID=A0ABT9Q159_9HYPH|nr:aminoglycoside phosphotransferase family protein [Neorhizobium huautlense]MDP9840215.1 streptomycin 6-kinase [Neorhizobium huautlense]